jgi:hypothetical protein
MAAGIYYYYYYLWHLKSDSIIWEKGTDRYYNCVLAQQWEDSATKERPGTYTYVESTYVARNLYFCTYDDNGTMLQIKTYSWRE